MIGSRLAPVLSCVIALVAVVSVAVPSRAAHDDNTFAVTIDSPTARVGQRVAIVATIAGRGRYRITESYRHRIQDLAAADAGVQVPGKIVRGTVSNGRVVFRIDVLPTTVGEHGVIGVFRFSVNDGDEHLDIKAVPFEVTVTATE